MPIPNQTATASAIIAGGPAQPDRAVASPWSTRDEVTIRIRIAHRERGPGLVDRVGQRVRRPGRRRGGAGDVIFSLSPAGAGFGVSKIRGQGPPAPAKAPRSALTCSHRATSPFTPRTSTVPPGYLRQSPTGDRLPLSDSGRLNLIIFLIRRPPGGPVCWGIGRCVLLRRFLAQSAAVLMEWEVPCRNQEQATGAALRVSWTRQTRTFALTHPVFASTA